MKKRIAFLLCLVLALLAFASCEKEIGAYRDQYDYEEEPVEDVTVNLYMPYEEGTTESALNTVTSQLVNSFKDRFSATLSMHFYPADEYQARTLAAVEQNKAPAAEESQKLIDKNIAVDLKTIEVNAATGETKKALKAELAALKAQKINYSVDLVLITGAEMMKQVAEKGSVTDLTSFLSTTTYGKLNRTITGALLNAAKTTDDQGATHLLALPNDHVLEAGYSLMVINKAYARDTLGISPEKLLAIRSSARATELLGEEAEGHWQYLEGQRYEQIAAYEREGNYVNIVATPVVGADEAFLSAFAIVNAVDDTYSTGTNVHSISAERAMQVIYALNNDAELHNLLQYGFSYANYYPVEESVNTITREGADPYLIAPYYGGNQFLSYFCGAWNAEAMENGKRHNASTDHPIVAPAEDPASEPTPEEDGSSLE